MYKGLYLIQDFDELENIELSNLLKKVFDYFSPPNFLGTYLKLENATYFIDENTGYFVIQRDKNKGNFTIIEKAKIKNAFENILNNPDYSKFLKGADVFENFINVYLEPELVYKRGGGVKKKELGDCYVVAGKIAMELEYINEFDFVGTPYVVHAEVTGQGNIKGVKYGHAWVEDDFNVYDYSNDRKIVIPKALYYFIGKIETDNPKKYRKYTFEEARKKMFDSGHYGCWDIETEFADGGEVKDKEATYKKWKTLVNMSKSELKKFYDSPEGKVAGLTSQESNELGISNGRQSARWIMKMKDTAHKDWTPEMWRWAKKQISFISRMKGNKGPLYDEKKKKTRKHTSLLIWGHNPNK